MKAWTTPSPWTPALIAQLKVLWADKTLSVAQIADELGVSRNAVIGKAHRLVLDPKAKSPLRRNYPKSRKPKGARVIVFKPPLVPDKDPAQLPPVMRVTPRRLQIWQMNDRHCRWPYGDPHKADFYFCAADREAGVPYCPAHMAKAFGKGKVA